MYCTALQGFTNKMMNLTFISLLAQCMQTVSCESYGQWTPNPGGVTCSPRPTQTFTQKFTQTFTLTSTPTQAPTSTEPGENQLTLPCTITVV